jgi:hypothetical protein
MRTFFARLSDPSMLPELPKLQVSLCAITIKNVCSSSACHGT